MSFTEQYVRAVNASDLRDDEHHGATLALIAAARADRTGSDKVLGSLLARVKYADGTISKLFHGNAANLAALLHIWTNAVREKGMQRRWIKVKAEWDLHAAFAMYEKIAHMSLAYWLGGKCDPCGGAGVTTERRICGCCKGSGKADIEGGRLEVELTKDMVSELEGLFQAHSARASKEMRRVG